MSSGTYSCWPPWKQWHQRPERSQRRSWPRPCQRGVSKLLLWQGEEHEAREGAESCAGGRTYFTVCMLIDCGVCFGLELKIGLKIEESG